MKTSFKQAIIPRGLEHWGRKLGFRNRVEIQALQYTKRALNMVGRDKASDLLEGRIGELQGKPGPMIAERQRAERGLKVSEARFKNFFEHANVGIVATGRDGRFIQANPAACKMLGFGERDLLNKTFQEITYWQDLQKSRKYLEQLLSGEVDSFIQEKRYIRSNGDIIWATISVSAVRDTKGEVLHFVTYIQDITERKQAENELAKYREHLEELVEERTAEIERIQRQLAHAHLAGGMGHIIKTELNLMSGLTVLLKKTARQNNDDYSLEKLERLEETILGLVGVMEQLLVLSKPMELNKERISHQHLPESGL